MEVPKSSSKRRPRTRQACEQCRARKMKCDGSLPCETCVTQNRVCRFSKPGKVKLPPALHILELEKQNEMLLSLLQKFVSPEELRKAGGGPVFVPLENGLQDNHVDYPPRDCADSQNELLETMIEETGRLHIDDGGNCTYRGHFGGLTLLEAIQDRCRRILTWPDQSRDGALPQEAPMALDYFDLFTSERSRTSARINLLPPKTVATYLITAALDDACCLIHFVHRPSFDSMFHRLYDLPPEMYGKEEERFLPLLYEVLALGRVFVADSPNFQDQSMKYFDAGKRLIDITNCPNLSSLQALLFIILYLQSLGRLSTCYSYLSLAIAMGLRMGIHRCVAPDKFDPIELETRKRIFWTLRTIDTYLTTILGLPKSINLEDSDQVLPMEIDDEELTKEGILPPSFRHNPKMAAVNAHTKLLLIMSKIVDNLHPVNRPGQEKNNYYRVGLSKIIEVERELEDWFKYFPQEVDFAGQESTDQMRTHLRLRMAYTHVQMVLYRPFLHHILQGNSSSQMDLRSYACASSCVKASSQMIGLAEQLNIQGFLTCRYWLTVFMTFFAAMSLLMFGLSDHGDPNVDDSMSAVAKAQKILLKLAQDDTTAQSCVATLNYLLSNFKGRPKTRKADTVAASLPHVESISTMLAMLSDRKNPGDQSLPVAMPELNTVTPPVLSLLENKPEAFNQFSDQLTTGGDMSTTSSAPNALGDLDVELSGTDPLLAPMFCRATGVPPPDLYPVPAARSSGQSMWMFNESPCNWALEDLPDISVLPETVPPSSAFWDF